MIYFTALDCHASQTYVAVGTPCYATCDSPNATEECTYPDTEICACTNPMHVLIDGECVPASQCGCIGNNCENS